MRLISNLGDLLQNSEESALTVKEADEWANNASQTVVQLVHEGSYTGELKAIRQYRKETGASLKVALRVIKVLKWRNEVSTSHS